VPTYDFSCSACDTTFEALILPGKAESAACPECGETRVERLLSPPALKTEGTRSRSLRSAQRREASRGRDRVEEQRRYEREHEGH
jgi:putative FmdB family regulatory protein